MGVNGTARLQREFAALLADPLPGVHVRPHPDNLFEWHVALDGAADGPYAGGQYHAVISLPPEYPMKAPVIRMRTPSGRFDVNASICLSFTVFHEETWNPSWTIRALVMGFMSFMNEEPTSGMVSSRRDSDAARRRMARESAAVNRADPAFVAVFPELAAPPPPAPAPEPSPSPTAPAPPPPAATETQLEPLPPVRAPRRPAAAGQKRRRGAASPPPPEQPPEQTQEPPVALASDTVDAAMLHAIVADLKATAAAPAEAAAEPVEAAAPRKRARRAEPTYAEVVAARDEARETAAMRYRLRPRCAANNSGSGSGAPAR